MPKKNTWKITGTGVLEQFRKLYPDVAWKEVRDAKQSKAYTVHAGDIKCSQPKDYLNCPMAMAIKNAPDGFRLPIVSERVTHLGNPRTGEILRFLNSSKLQHEIVRCDQSPKGEFVPATYLLVPHPASSKIGVSHHHQGNRPPRKLGNRQKKVVRGWRELVEQIRATDEKIIEPKKKGKQPRL